MFSTLAPMDDVDALIMLALLLGVMLALGGLALLLVRVGECVTERVRFGAVHVSTGRTFLRMSDARAWCAAEGHPLHELRRRRLDGEDLTLRDRIVRLNLTADSRPNPPAVNFRPRPRPQRVAIIGARGAGRTYTALLAAQGVEGLSLPVWDPIDLDLRTPITPAEAEALLIRVDDPPTT